MLNKKINFLFLFFLCYSAIGSCMEITSNSLCSKYERDIAAVKKELLARYNAAREIGLSPRVSTFFYAIYTAKTKADFYNALMGKGEFYIRLYHKEQIGSCSAFGITIMADSASFEDKKEFIATLLAHQFKPTVQDKEFEFFRKLKASTQSIVKKIPLSQYISYEIELPQEIKDYIATSLFWLTYNEIPSLF